MRSDLVSILACPECHGRLALHGREMSGGQVDSGDLACESCALSYPIVKGIPRFTGNSDEYAGNFGWQWDRFRKTQVDAFNGTKESEERFLAETGWRPDGLKGLLVLDAGCGSGRFSAVAAGWGARVVAVDLAGAAAEACARNMRELGLQVDVVQASLFHLPFAPGVVDRVFSLGVLQHTPDPRRALKALPGILKPDGMLACWIYEKRWYRFFMVRNYLRWFTKRWATKTNWRLSIFLVFMFFPLAFVLSLLPVLRKGQPLLPISSRLLWGRLSLRQAFEWTLLDTFDSYSAVYENAQREKDVRDALGEAGLLGIRRTPARGMALVGKKGPGLGGARG